MIVAVLVTSRAFAVNLARQVDFHIPRQSLSAALIQFSYQARLQVIVKDDVHGQMTQGVNGTQSIAQALSRLLHGSDLKYRVAGDTSIVIGRHLGAVHSPKHDRVIAAHHSSPNLSQDKSPAQPPGSQAAARQSGLSTARLQEVVVTAEKVKQNPMDVPMSLTVLTGNALMRSHSFRFQDYVNSVPGLTLVNYGAFGSQLVIRGITAGSVPINTAVATYIDETPFGVEGSFAGSGFAAPDIDTFDMRRIEVLRGPQGTLYGANALAGVVKYVTNPPDLRHFQAEVETGISSVSHGGVGFDVHGMINLPLSSVAALRLVGYQNFYPGFINDPSRGLTGINGVHYSGGRASFLYKPNDRFSIRLNALYQNRTYGDLSNEDVNPGSLTPIHANWIQENLVGQPGRTMDQVYNATVKWNAGFAKLVSSTSYMRFEPDSIWDYSKEFEPILTQIFGKPLGAVVLNIRPAKAWTQELRLTSGHVRRLRWLVGSFFTDENSREYEAIFPVNVSSRGILYNFSPQLDSFIIPTHYREYAGFIHLNYAITPTLNLGVGGRYSHNDQQFQETESGLFAGSGANFTTRSSEGVFTYSSSLRWKIKPDRVLYGRVAKGFVPGGPNDVVPTATSIAKSYASSTTTDYDVGFKGRFLHDRISTDLSVFYIDWKRIQVLATEGPFDSITNGGTAHSEGVEWGFGYVPIYGLKLSWNGSYTHAFLTQNTPASVGGLAGDRLPFVPLLESSVSADYSHPVADGYSSFAAVSYRIDSSRYADFSANGPRQEMPSYQILNFRLGLQSARWSIEAYVKNIGNEIAINDVAPETLAGGTGPQSAVLNTPRTFGLSTTVWLN